MIIAIGASLLIAIAVIWSRSRPAALPKSDDPGQAQGILAPPAPPPINPEIAILKSELAALGEQKPLSRAVALRLATANAALTRLAGAADPDVKRWTELLTARERRLTALRSALDIIDAADHLSDERIDQLTTEVAEWTSLNTPDDADAARWSATLTAFRKRLTGMRSRLARLDTIDQPGLPLAEELKADLATYRTLTAPEDPQRLAWEAKVAATVQRIAGLRKELIELLEPAATLSLDQLISAERLLVTYRSEVRPDDTQLVAWESRVTSERRTVDSMRKNAERLTRPNHLTAAERESALAGVAGLAARAGASQDELTAWRQRIDGELNDIAALREALAAHFTAGTSLGQQANGIAIVLAPMVGDDDLESKSLLAKREELRLLAERLAVLDRVASVPPDIDATLGQWIALTPPNEANRVRWSAKLERIKNVRAICSALDHVQEPPADCAARLEELSGKLVGGNDADVRRWSARLAEIERLRRKLREALAASFVKPSVNGDLAALAALVGETAELTSWRARARLLTDSPWALETGSDEAGPWASFVVADLTIRLRQVTASPVSLGSPPDEKHRDDDEVAIMVNLTPSFWMAETEVTQRLWTAVMNDNPSTFPGQEKPVDSVSWDDAQAFCERLGTLVPNLEPRLPSEAEWELACRAGNAGPYHGPAGELSATTLNTVAWYDGSHGSHDVARLASNGLGLFDMHGNVWEWCADQYVRHPEQPEAEWPGSLGEQRVVRGGSWADPPEALRAANRVALKPDVRSRMVGLRIAATIATAAPAPLPPAPLQPNK